MHAKPNLLIVGDYSRPDFINLLQSCFADFNFFFLHFSSVKEIPRNKREYYQQVGTAIFWGDYKHANELLDSVSPHKVVFFFIESYHQVLLNIFCRIRGVYTYHLDHGIRDIDINLRLENEVLNQKEQLHTYPFYLKIHQFSSRLRSRLFLIRSKKLLPPAEATFYNSYIKIRATNNWLETFKRTVSPFRLPSAYIVFNERALNVYKHYDKYPQDTKIHKIGIPIFDGYYKVRKNHLQSNNIILIDQGLAERGLYGWTEPYYHSFLQQLKLIAQTHGYQLHVKPHPKQNNLGLIQKLNIPIVTDESILELLSKTSVIAGFASTFLLPLIAQKYLTLFTLENHPAGSLNVSKPFIEAGVAEPIYSLNELDNLLLKIEELHQKQLPNKAKFTEEWMYKFDGRAGERLRDILLSSEP